MDKQFREPSTGSALISDGSVLESGHYKWTRFPRHLYSTPYVDNVIMHTQSDKRSVTYPRPGSSDSAEHKPTRFSGPFENGELLDCAKTNCRGGNLPRDLANRCSWLPTRRSAVMRPTGLD